MIRWLLPALGLAVGLAGPAAAQNSSAILIVPPEDDGTLLLPNPDADSESLLEPDLDLNFVPRDFPEQADPVIAALRGEGAVLRGLDKLNGTVTDLELAPGQTGLFGKLQVTLGECRFPEENPSGDAYAYLVIRADDTEVPVFEGWMFASSPALNAMDHARYDVWVLRCKMPSAEGGSG